MSKARITQPAYLVEGQHEQMFIQDVCPGSPVQRINCNGNRTSLQAIAKRVGTLGRLLHKRYSPLVVIFDREGRRESPEEIERAFAGLMAQEEIDCSIILGVPDRNVESWIIADFEMFARCIDLKSTSIPIRSEGKNGKAIIKKLLGKRKRYVETIEGVAMLKAARASIIRSQSPSFNRLFTALSPLDCWWLNRD